MVIDAPTLGKEMTSAVVITFEIVFGRAGQARLEFRHGPALRWANTSGGVHASQLSNEYDARAFLRSRLHLPCPSRFLRRHEHTTFGRRH